jgi:hypothetical protein
MMLLAKGYTLLCVLHKGRDRNRCDSSDGSSSSSIGYIPRLVEREREIVDSSDDESQASNGTLGGAYRAEQFIGCRFDPTRKKTNDDGSKVGSVKS